LKELIHKSFFFFKNLRLFEVCDLLKIDLFSYTNYEMETSLNEWYKKNILSINNKPSNDDDFKKFLIKFDQKFIEFNKNDFESFFYLFHFILDMHKLRNSQKPFIFILMGTQNSGKSQIIEDLWDKKRIKEDHLNTIFPISYEITDNQIVIDMPGYIDIDQEKEKNYDYVVPTFLKEIYLILCHSSDLLILVVESTRANTEKSISFIKNTFQKIETQKFILINKSDMMIEEIKSNFVEMNFNWDGIKNKVHERMIELKSNLIKNSTINENEIFFSSLSKSIVFSGKNKIDIMKERKNFYLDLCSKSDIKNDIFIDDDFSNKICLENGILSVIKIKLLEIGHSYKLNDICQKKKIIINNKKKEIRNWD
jgi:GTP-binding protein EngB required for normal cell division